MGCPQRVAHSSVLRGRTPSKTCRSSHRGPGIITASLHSKSQPLTPPATRQNAVEAHVQELNILHFALSELERAHVHMTHQVPSLPISSSSKGVLGGTIPMAPPVPAPVYPPSCAFCWLSSLGPRA